MQHFPIRPAREADATFLAGIQLSAGALFRTLPDIAWIAGEPVGEAESYLPLIAAGTVWVAEAGDGTLAGVLLGEVTGDDLHILELAVSAEHQQHGIGRALLDAARDYAAARGLAAVTLTTFRHVAWNGPFYVRYGFVEVREDELDEHLAHTVRAETERGLPNRCAMRLAL
jgi:GNAT superfamily N-acetyltransferase